ncbi:vgr related protein [Altericroceibacterium spongiae]|uniref:Vgr related protein n=2 Tax=Altericroceibacterium spongiae TaxID=2320269 RepID=A0A420ESF5_9SPHN|nr:vgr related protein [Altericroceibacterium spongiae]
MAEDQQHCPPGGARPLTRGETGLVRFIFGSSVDCSRVTIKRRKWFPLQPVQTVMAPRGHLHFHPDCSLYEEDFAAASLSRQGLFLHEMTHVWQTQKQGEWHLILRRHPFCRYDYSLKPGWSLDRYGLEQQAEIIRHAFLMRKGVAIAGVADKTAYDVLVRFPGAG